MSGSVIETTDLLMSGFLNNFFIILLKLVLLYCGSH